MTILYGYKKDETTTVVTASKKLEDFTAWFANLDGLHYMQASETDFMVHMTDPEFNPFSKTVYIIRHKHAAEQTKFIAHHDIIVLNHAQAVDKNIDMALREEPDPYDANATQTIGEITGTDKHDPWDKRTDEQKAEDEQMKELAKEMRMNGQLTGESFAPKKSGGVHVDRVDVTQNADGSVTIDGALAHKYKGNEASEAKKQADDMSRKVEAERMADAMQKSAGLVDDILSAAKK